MILHTAKSAGMDTLDTAISYGKSEQCLGKVGIGGWRIITKLPKLPDACTDVSGWVNNQVNDSMLRLNVPNLTGLLLHQPNQLLGSKGKVVWKTLQKLKEDGVIKKVGFSVYDPNELDVLWPLFQPDLVQAPFNILDRRLETSGWLQRMNEENVEVHVRSVFLQGLLLMNNSNRPKKFNRWSTVWNAWDAWLCEQNLTAQQACLGFVMKDARINRVIIGVDTLYQLEEILLSTETKINQFPQLLTKDNSDLINPYCWNSL